MSGFRTLEQLEAFSTCELPEGTPRESDEGTAEPVVEATEPEVEVVEDEPAADPVEESVVE